MAGRGWQLVDKGGKQYEAVFPAMDDGIMGETSDERREIITVLTLPIWQHALKVAMVMTGKNFSVRLKEGEKNKRGMKWEGRWGDRYR